MSQVIHEPTTFFCKVCFHSGPLLRESTLLSIANNPLHPALVLHPRMMLSMNQTTTLCCMLEWQCHTHYLVWFVQINVRSMRRDCNSHLAIGDRTVELVHP
jgi:hypothetical protein